MFKYDKANKQKYIHCDQGREKNSTGQDEHVGEIIQRQQNERVRGTL